MNEVEALVILSEVPNLGAIKIRFLLEKYGSAQNVLTIEKKEIESLTGFGPKISQHWQQWKSESSWKKNLELVEKFGVRLTPFTSPQYPKRLLEIYDHPVLLYVQGELKESDQQCLAVIGTRQASLYGLDFAYKISEQLARARYTVVSGFARGIDTAAHEGALKGGGRTIAVIGSGLAQIYPRENTILAKKVVEQGALVSEFPMSTPPDRQNFPQRNRIVSGMTLGSILIEAPLESGAMLTMGKALSQKRKLFVLPGRVSENFAGNHALIKSGKAHLIENAQDVLSHFDDLFARMPEQATKQNFVLSTLGKEEKEFLEILPDEDISFDEMALITNFTAMKLNTLLMGLVLKKAIREYPGRRYKKNF